MSRRVGRFGALLISTAVACESRGTIGTVPPGAAPGQATEAAPSPAVELPPRPSAEVVANAIANAIADITVAPKVGPADAPHANVFKPLDGHWDGEFRIYVRSDGPQPGGAPQGLTPADLAKPPYTLSSTIKVHQHYVSESPYFQRVAITDTNPDGTTVRSRGVNKVQAGRLWCVVLKPDDQVIHDGVAEGANTLIWTRNRAEPQAIERFRETVRGDTYSIFGWGWYGGADPEKTPSCYFHAVYRRSKTEPGDGKVGEPE